MEILLKIRETCPKTLEAITPLLQVSKYDTLTQFIQDESPLAFFARPIESGRVQYNDADILVGFIAKTELSFTFEIGPHIKQEFTLKPGEFAFAFYGGAYPLLSTMFHTATLSSLQGSGFALFANINDEPRKSLQVMVPIPLGENYSAFLGLVQSNEYLSSEKGQAYIREVYIREIDPVAKDANEKTLEMALRMLDETNAVLAQFVVKEMGVNFKLSKALKTKA